MLAEQCTALLRVEACGVLLIDVRGTLGLATAVPHADRLLEVFQLESHEGPCLDCVRTGEPVRSNDLAADARRWPMWSEVALEQGFRTAYATPLRVGERIIGTLNLFGRDPIGLSEDDLLLIRALADVATVTILQRRGSDDAAAVNQQLQHALQSRVQVEQAKGVVAQALEVSMDRAFEVIRHSSRSTNTKLGVVCGALISGTVRPSELVSPAMTGRSARRSCGVHPDRHVNPPARRGSDPGQR